MNNNVRKVKDSSGTEHILRSGADLSNIDFTGADFINAELHGINFTGANFTDAKLSGTDFVYNANSELKPAILTNVTWPTWYYDIKTRPIIVTDKQIMDLDRANFSARNGKYDNNGINEFILASRRVVKITEDQTSKEQRGMQQEDIRSKQVRIQERLNRATKALLTNNEEESDTENECKICFEPFIDGDTVVDAHKYENGKPGHHLFHKNCLLKWCKRQQTCPYCREEIRTICNEISDNIRKGGKRSKKRVTNKKTINKKVKRRQTNKKGKRKVTNKR